MSPLLTSYDAVKLPFFVFSLLSSTCESFVAALVRIMCRSSEHHMMQRLKEQGPCCQSWSAAPLITRSRSTDAEDRRGGSGQLLMMATQTQWPSKVGNTLGLHPTRLPASSGPPAATAVDLLAGLTRLLTFQKFRLAFPYLSSQLPQIRSQNNNLI